MWHKFVCDWLNDKKKVVLKEKKSWQKSVSKYVGDKKEEVIKTFLWLSSCCGLRVKVLALAVYYKK